MYVINLHPDSLEGNRQGPAAANLSEGGCARMMAVWKPRDPIHASEGSAAIQA
jgi:hypothetical protein